MPTWLGQLLALCVTRWAKGTHSAPFMNPILIAPCLCISSVFLRCHAGGNARIHQSFGGIQASPICNIFKLKLVFCDPHIPEYVRWFSPSWSCPPPPPKKKWPTYNIRGVHIREYVAHFPRNISGHNFQQHGRYMQTFSEPLQAKHSELTISYFQNGQGLELIRKEGFLNLLLLAMAQVPLPHRKTFTLQRTCCSQVAAIMGRWWSVALQSSSTLEKTRRLWHLEGAEGKAEREGHLRNTRSLD